MVNESAIERTASLIAAQLPGGIFLCVGGSTPNVMTVGWGGYNFYWRKHIFVAPVRPQRFTYPILQAQREFTLSVPQPGTMKEALMKAGTLSGRDVDKFQAIGLQTAKAREMDACVISGCALYLECRVLAQNDFINERTDPAVIDFTYSAGDFHTLFYGEIIACYEGEKP